MIVLAVILPIAHLTNLLLGAPAGRLKPTTRAAECGCRLKGLGDVLELLFHIVSRWRHCALRRELHTFFRPQIHEMLQTVQFKGIWNLTVLFVYRPRISKVR